MLYLTVRFRLLRRFVWLSLSKNTTIFCWHFQDIVAFSFNTLSSFHLVVQSDWIIFILKSIQFDLGCSFDVLFNLFVDRTMTFFIELFELIASSDSLRSCGQYFIVPNELVNISKIWADLAQMVVKFWKGYSLQ